MSNEKSNEISEEFRAYSAKIRVVTEKIVREARAVIPALLDAGKIHSAKGLQEAFFEFDALQEAMLDKISQDPRRFLEEIRRDLEP